MTPRLLLVVHNAPVVLGGERARDGEVERGSRIDDEQGAVEVRTDRDVRGGPGSCHECHGPRI
jgi:hypothetical protein